MASEFHRNAEKYYDPTAGTALTNVEREKFMEWKAGDIITASRGITEKKFIVLANDGFVLTGSVLLTREYESCVPVICGDKMFVNPYRIEYLRQGDYDMSLVRVATDDEMGAVHTAISKALSLPVIHEVAFTPQSEPEASDSDDYIEMVENQAKELIEANARADVYKELYENLLARCLKTA